MPSFTYSKVNYIVKLRAIWKIYKNKNLFSITGTSTACNVFGLNLEPGFKAPQPAAQPNFPKKSSFFSGKHMGAEIFRF